MSSDGIDISNWQAGLDLEQVPHDFVICKATEGVGFIDPTFRSFTDTSLRLGKMTGAYHFARTGSATDQAAYFVDVVRDYVGKITLWLDWETAPYDESTMDQGVGWALEWLREVERLTGTKPGIYTSKSVTNSWDWSPVVAEGFPLWGAQYASYDEVWGYDHDPWESMEPWGAWRDCMIHQYTGNLRLSGYDGGLDGDILWDSVERWNGLIGSEGVDLKPITKHVLLIDCANVAATLHAMMCDDDEHFGYAWDPRQGGDLPGSAVVVINGYEYEIPYGSWDCSSSICWCWRQALRYTPFEGALDGATYTGNMRECFVSSGLFEAWATSETSAVRGDVYLQDEEHTAMCQDGGDDGVYGYDALSEFCINENGGCYGGQPGDQTGTEAYVHGYYGDGYWWVTLHYNGGANTYTDQEVIPSTPSSGDICYRVSSDPSGRDWYDEMHGDVDTGGSDDDYAGEYGEAIRWLACDAKRYRVYTEENGWLPWVDQYNIHDLEYGCAGDGSPIILVQVDDDTVWHCVHETDGDGWWSWLVGMRDTGGSGDDVAGDDSPIDCIRMRRAA